MAGTTGGVLALYAAKRRDAIGAALGTIGLGLLVRGLSNRERVQRESNDFMAQEVTG